jgi:hypothetical protein
MLNLIQNVKFKKAEKIFLKNLSKDTLKIKENDHLLIAADKTTNIYKV